MKVLAISGSLRPNSYNRRLLELAARLAPAAVRVQIWDGLASVPPYAEHVDGPLPPAPVRKLRSAIAYADALLLATPEYNGSLPGALKNALDWASRPFPGSALNRKPVAVVGASTGLFGAVWAQAELRKVLGVAGARVLAEELPVGQADQAFDEAGHLRDDQLTARLAGIIDQLAVTVAQVRDPAGQARDPAGQARDPAGQARDPAGPVLLPSTISVLVPMILALPRLLRRTRSITRLR
jgi:chromate reductase, NAD(P)H dehydrogenase (quinone)